MFLVSKFFDFKTNPNNIENNVNNFNNMNQGNMTPNYNSSEYNAAYNNGEYNNQYNSQQYNDYNNYNEYNGNYNNVSQEQYGQSFQYNQSNQSNLNTQYNQNNQAQETFVYNSYPNEVSNSDNFESMRPLENYMPYQESPAKNQNTNISYNDTYPNMPNNYNMNSMDNNEVLDMQVDPLNKEETPKPTPEPVLDPLNNANNPIPVNPVAEVKETYVEEELPTNVKANIFSVIGMMFGMILTPGMTIVTNSKKYRSTNKALMVTTWITVVTLVLCIAARIVVGAFNKTYSAVTSSYKISLNFANVFSLDNYIQYLLIAFVISFGCILITALIYYASSFLNSKGVPFGSYLMVSNLALLPFIIGVVCLYPVANLISTYIGLLVLIFAFLYTLVSFLTGIGEVLTFKNPNREILYNVLNISIIVLVMIIVFSILINSSMIILPELNL